MAKIYQGKKIVILGGGLAGLAAGYELSKAKFKVIVLEKQAQVGGLAQTIQVGQFRFDSGPHRWYAKSDLVNQWMLNLLKGEIIKVPRLTRIYFDQKFFYYPIKLLNALLGIGLFKSLLAIYDYFQARLKVRLFKPKLVTMEDGYITQFGKTLYEIFFKRYSEKLWGVDCQKISIDWIGQRTRGLNILTIIKDTIFKSKNVVSLVDEFFYPKKGIGRIAEKLAEQIQKNGGEIYTQAEVLEVNHKLNKIISVKAKKKNQETMVITGDNFISSIPLNDLVNRLKPKVDPAIRRHASRLKFRDELQVALFVKKSHITNDTWIYVHPKEIPFMRVMEMDNWSKYLAPEGSTTLVFEIACNQKDSLWRKSDQDIIGMVTDSYLNEFKLINKEVIMGGYVHRVEKEYPVYHIDYQADVFKIKSYLTKFNNLQLIGRNGTFRYNNMDHSIEMGLYAAWNISGGRKTYDIESVNIEREYLEEKRLENIEDESLEKTTTD